MPASQLRRDAYLREQLSALTYLLTNIEVVSCELRIHLFQSTVNDGRCAASHPLSTWKSELLPSGESSVSPLRSRTNQDQMSDVSQQSISFMVRIRSKDTWRSWMDAQCAGESGLQEISSSMSVARQLSRGYENWVVSNQPLVRVQIKYGEVMQA